jgi:ankyrin repeat, SAM and basic leucine zipper domain-containing protein 1
LLDKFCDHSRPAYFPDLGALLYGMRMEQFTPNVAKVDMNLTQFLTIDDGTLQDLGLTLPLERKRVHLGLLK